MSYENPAMIIDKSHDAFLESLNKGNQSIAQLQAQKEREAVKRQNEIAEVQRRQQSIDQYALSQQVKFDQLISNPNLIDDEVTNMLEPLLDNAINAKMYLETMFDNPERRQEAMNDIRDYTNILNLTTQVTASFAEKTKFWSEQYNMIDSKIALAGVTRDERARNQWIMNALSGKIPNSVDISLHYDPIVRDMKIKLSGKDIDGRDYTGKNAVEIWGKTWLQNTDEDTAGNEFIYDIFQARHKLQKTFEVASQGENPNGLGIMIGGKINPGLISGEGEVILNKRDAVDRTGKVIGSKWDERVYYDIPKDAILGNALTIIDEASITDQTLQGLFNYNLKGLTRNMDELDGLHMEAAKALGQSTESGEYDSWIKFQARLDWMTKQENHEINKFDEIQASLKKKYYPHNPNIRTTDFTLQELQRFELGEILVEESMTNIHGAQGPLQWDEERNQYYITQYGKTQLGTSGDNTSLSDTEENMISDNKTVNMAIGNGDLTSVGASKGLIVERVKGSDDMYQVYKMQSGNKVLAYPTPLKINTPYSDDAKKFKGLMGIKDRVFEYDTGYDKDKDKQGGYKAKQRNIKGVDENIIIRKFEDALLQYNTDEDDIIKALDDDPITIGEGDNKTTLTLNEVLSSLGLTLQQHQGTGSNEIYITSDAIPDVAAAKNSGFYYELKNGKWVSVVDGAPSLSEVIKLKIKSIK